MEYFFSCDWGTSAFRLRLIHTADLSIVTEISNSAGCANTNQEWLKAPNQKYGRYTYYKNLIASHIQDIKQRLHIETEHIPLVISGMASSTIGMVNLPYKEAPFLINGADLIAEIVKETENFPHNTIIISGVRTAEDVMRGEETKLIGCLDNNNETEQIIVLPGTHAKHVYIKQNQVTGFKTYMTGEFFNLLSQKSILSLSVKESRDFDRPVFEAGVTEGASGNNILHSAFLVRTNLLFDKYTPEQNFDYLSGLLLGFELKDLIGLPEPVLLGDEKLGDIYQKAFKVLGIKLCQIINADEALIKGQYKLLVKTF